MSTSKLDQLLGFVRFIHKFQAVKRKILVTGENRDENDLEHVGQIALVAWYIVSTQKIKLNLDLVIKYALAHDLVEVYAGDTYFYSGTDPKIKQQKERKALEKIKKEFSEFSDLGEIIEAYEAKIDLESKFIYALDKLVPAMNIYLDGGKSWRRDKVSLKILIEGKVSKVKVDPNIKKYFDELTRMLSDKELELFPKS